MDRGQPPCPQNGGTAAEREHFPRAAKNGVSPIDDRMCHPVTSKLKLNCESTSSVVECERVVVPRPDALIIHEILSGGGSERFGDGRVREWY